MLVKFKKRLYPQGSQGAADTYTISLYEEVNEQGKKKEVRTIVGYGLPEGKEMLYEVEGEWVTHKQYGKQLKLISYQEVITPNRDGIISYLKSGQIKGIGPELAERIYSQFGADTLNVLDQNPEKLKDIKGVGEKKLEKIIESYTKNRAARDLIAFLSQYGISPRRALSLFKIYKANALDVIRQDPYRLCENAGIGFKTADQIAMNLGISGFIGWSFGTWQLLVNAIILVVVFFQVRSCIGAGTIINMVFVGYIADFICYVANDVVQIQMNLPLRILALLLAQLMASMGVALYMVADMGIAPYDSVAIIIEKLTHQKIPFHKARILSDVVVVIIGIIFAIASGEGIWSVVGIGTIINACFNGPLIQFFKTKLEMFYL